jgi:hypothetical protein
LTDGHCPVCKREHVIGLGLPCPDELGKKKNYAPEVTESGRPHECFCNHWTLARLEKQAVNPAPSDGKGGKGKGKSKGKKGNW